MMDVKWLEPQPPGLVSKRASGNFTPIPGTSGSRPKIQVSSSKWSRCWIIAFDLVAFAFYLLHLRLLPSAVCLESCALSLVP
jgi:hypothetical protein